ncbi:hypothetical protein Y032_0139g2089 [Ancylostoma ceylanicum]|uniref:Uncharacterized protein n=1 Tax=Ancylostoma ceylanicum TaxID=53326 RepID=A0A016T4H3_9BILA|nr:hypothetical protein Y032_0139g2089 [Ancylostoma ceylanicum]
MMYIKSHRNGEISVFARVDEGAPSRSATIHVFARKRVLENALLIVLSAEELREFVELNTSYICSFRSA